MEHFVYTPLNSYQSNIWDVIKDNDALIGRIHFFAGKYMLESNRLISSNGTIIGMYNSLEAAQKTAREFVNKPVMEFNSPELKKIKFRDLHLYSKGYQIGVVRKNEDGTYSVEMMAKDSAWDSSKAHLTFPYTHIVRGADNAEAHAEEYWKKNSSELLPILEALPILHRTEFTTEDYDLFDIQFRISKYKLGEIRTDTEASEWRAYAFNTDNTVTYVGSYSGGGQAHLALIMWHMEHRIQFQVILQEAYKQHHELMPVMLSGPEPKEHSKPRKRSRRHHRKELTNDSSKIVVQALEAALAKCRDKINDALRLKCSTDEDRIRALKTVQEYAHYADVLSTEIIGRMQPAEQLQRSRKP